MKTATVLFLALSIASSASAAAVIDPSANTRRIGPPGSDNGPRSPVAVSSSGPYNTTDGGGDSPASAAAIKAAARRRPWGWNNGQPPSVKQRRSAASNHDDNDDDNVGAFVVSAGLLKGTGTDSGSSGNTASSNADSTTSTNNDNNDNATEPRRRPGGWRFRLPRDTAAASPPTENDDDDDDDERESPDQQQGQQQPPSTKTEIKRRSSSSSSSSDSDPPSGSKPSYMAIGTWAGIIVGASAGASLLAAGLYAGVVKRRQRSASRAERQALYAEKREEDDRRVWEGDDEGDVAGDWGVNGEKGGMVGAGGDLEKRGVVVEVQDYRGVSRG